MKATKLLVTAAVFAGLASLSFAGPGPEYWARMNSKPSASYPTIWRTKDTAGTMAKPAAKPDTDTALSCANCSCCAKKV